MNEGDVKALALFSYFAYLDDSRASDAASKALVFASERIRKNKSGASSGEAIVYATHKVWQELQGHLLRGHPTAAGQKIWQLPKGLDLGPWKEFQKNATEDELLVVIWSQILGINDEDIAQALGVTEGTIRYRMARALRKLGAMNQPARR